MNGTWHREHLLCRCTATRLGFPFEPPISDGTGPLGFLLLIFRLRLVHPPDERLKYVVEIGQNVLEFLCARLSTLLSQVAC